MAKQCTDSKESHTFLAYIIIHQNTFFASVFLFFNNNVNFPLKIYEKNGMIIQKVRDFMYVERLKKLISVIPANATLILSPENLYYFSGFTGGEGMLYIDKNRLL